LVKWITDLSQLKRTQDISEDQYFREGFLRQSGSQSAVCQLAQKTSGQIVDPTDLRLQLAYPRIQKATAERSRIVIVYNSYEKLRDEDDAAHHFLRGKKGASYHLAKLIIKFINNWLIRFVLLTPPFVAAVEIHGLESHWLDHTALQRIDVQQSRCRSNRGRAGVMMRVRISQLLRLMMASQVNMTAPLFREARMCAHIFISGVFQLAGITITIRERSAVAFCIRDTLDLAVRRFVSGSTICPRSS